MPHKIEVQKLKLRLSAEMMYKIDVERCCTGRGHALPLIHNSWQPSLLAAAVCDIELLSLWSVAHFAL